MAEQTLKVLHLVCEPGRTEALETAGALSRYAADRAEQLEVDLWAPKEPAGTEPRNSAAAAGVTRRGLRSTLALRSHILRTRTRLVHCHDPHGAAAVASLKETGHMPPACYTVYAPLLEEGPSRPLADAARKAFARLLRRYMDGIIAPSAFARGLVISQGAFRPEKVHRVTRGVSAPGRPRRKRADQAGRPDGEARGHRRREGHPEPPAVLLLPVNVPQERRRRFVNYFLQAARILHARAAEAELLLPCPRVDAAFVRETGHRLGLEGAVRVEALEDLPGLVERCAVAVLPTEDIRGISPLLEAMAAGKAVVAPDLGGVREFIDGRSSGQLVRPGDAQALGQALAGLVSSEAARRSLGGGAARAAARDFSLEQMARELTAVYRRLAPR